MTSCLAFLRASALALAVGAVEPTRAVQPKSVRYIGEPLELRLQP